MNRPPQLAEKIFTALCGQAAVEDLLGDLEELYQINSAKHGKGYAKSFYWFQMLRLSFSYAITKRKNQHKNSVSQNNNLITMLKSYFKISVRNIIKQKSFTFLSVFGLALGMSIALLALAMIMELHQFDKFHKDSAKIYRVTTEIAYPEKTNRFASAPTALAYLCDNTLPSITEKVHINDMFFPSVKTIGDPLRLSGYLTEPSFLDMFSFPLIEGSKSGLSMPGKVIITSELAEKLFGQKPAMNQILKTENWGNLEVAGILAPFPKNTHFTFDLLAAIPSKLSNNQQWTDFNGNFYYFKSNESIASLEKEINALGSAGLPFFKAQNIEAKYRLQPILDINPGPDLDDEVGLVFDKPSILIFIGTALLILLPSCINYVNMAIASALKRSKEIGIRKVMGGQSEQIVHQFLLETILICLIALGISSIFFYFIRDEFVAMLAGASSLTFALNLKLVLVFVLFAICTGLLTGLVPAFFYAKTSPIAALRNTIGSNKVSISGIRKGLMIFQFVVSLVLMIGIGVLVRQYQHSLTYNLGFHKENVLVIPIESSQSELLKNSFLSNPDVKDLSFSSSIPGTPLSRSVYFFSEDKLDSVRAREVFIDDQFIDHMEIEMAWGSGELRKDHLEQILVNQSLMDKLNNLNSSAKDSLLSQFQNDRKVQIVGVIKDYNHEPLNERIEPMVMRISDSDLNYALVSITSQNLPKTLATLENGWNQLYPNQPFKATFLDTEIKKAYDFFKAGIKIFGFLALLAVTISSLGLLGMVIYSTENRTKEVAIRKILGANGFSLLKSLSNTFFKMWAIALIIAVPSAYLFYDSVLVSIYNKFSGGVGFAEILFSTMATVSIGVLAILWQTQKIMKTNPVHNLRNE
ncbi:FtsX-like permease family protein [uncultured Roseivirga sp.]|uniref:FtsX-like permease family protein n=1 Tax=uncultured Roseivirga sp. TaxID=543088 RepID=UPI0030DCAEBD